MVAPIDLLVDLLAPIRSFIELGGNVLWAIMVVLLMMWTLIIERYWFLFRIYPDRRTQVLAAWRARDERRSWQAVKIKTEIVSDMRLELHKNISMIQALISICPLLGLLGTVTGMVMVFEVMAFFGTGNARAMADGVSKATIPTMAGMVAALSGVYFASNLERKAILESDRLEDMMRTE